MPTIPSPLSTIPQQWHHWWHQAVIMLLELMVYHRGVQGLACSCLKGTCLHLRISIVMKDFNRRWKSLRFGYISNFPVYAAYSEIAWRHGMYWCIKWRQPMHLTLKRSVHNLQGPPNPSLQHRLQEILIGIVNYGHVHGRHL